MEIPNASADCTIVTTRVMNFPQELIFRAWTEPDHLKNWWGPKDFSNTFNRFELWPGGKWSFIMHGPDGGYYPNECEFIAIQNPTMIAFNHTSDPKFQVLAMFEEVIPDKTKVTFSMIFGTVNECNKIRSFATGKNEENMDRLEAELAVMASGTN